MGPTKNPKAVDELLDHLAEELEKLSPEERAKNLADGAAFVADRSRGETPQEQK